MKFNSLNIMAGGIAMSIGLFVAIWSTAYPAGTLARMGPGYFPMFLGVILLALGSMIILFESREIAQVEDGEAEPSFLNWMRMRAVAILIAAPLAFALLIEPAGLMPAVFAAVFISTFADRTAGLVRATLLGACMAATAALIFKVVLNLPFDLIG